MDPRKLLEEIIALDERVAELMERFDEAPEPERAATLEQVLEETRRAAGEDDPLPLAMVRATEMAVFLDTAGAPLLAAGLDHANPDVRHLTGQALLNLAAEDLERLRPVIDYALERGGDAAEELIFVLADIEDDEAPRVIERFLGHREVGVVATAIEALAEVGDEQSIVALEEHVDDRREVRLLDDDDSGEQETWRVGDIAREAIETLERELDEED